MAKSEHKIGVWTTDENGYEKTGSPEIIQQVLSTVKQKHRIIILLFKGYQSGPTVFVSIDPEMLIIDKPVDWSGLKRVRVVFKDDANVWNHFTVSVVGEGKDTVKTEFPTELFRLQRRSHFRIDVSVASRVSFLLNDDPVKDVVLGNISIGGLMLYFNKGEQPGKIKDQEVITNIEVELHPPISEEDQGQKKIEVICVSKGVCVRAFEDKALHKYCLGVKFEPTPNEEIKLLQYVRQLELEELRKGFVA